MVEGKPAGETPVIPLVGAGVITVKGSDTAELADAPDGIYPPLTPELRIFLGGETLRISASGRVVPAFATTLTAPSPVIVTAPTATSVADSRSYTADRSRDLTLTWTGGGVGLLSFYMLSEKTASSYLRAECRFPGEAGQGTVPAAVLGRFTRDTISVNAWPWTSTAMDVADWTIDIEANAAATIPDGTPFFGTMTLQ